MNSIAKMASSILAVLISLMGVAAAQDDFDRTSLPIQRPVSDPITEMDARNATKPERFEIKAPRTLLLC
jgi:hypothetical protein